jgi:hypothetical protein
MKVAAFFVALGLLAPLGVRDAAADVAYVPLDDRPVTRQLPQMLGDIAGVRVLEPPRASLGWYLRPGDSDAIVRWLNVAPARNARSFAISSDMLAYGGLVASRTPETPYADAAFRLRELAHLRAEHPRAWIGAFGTIMRLAPTGVPAIGDARNFFAAYPVWPYLQQYANLPDPPGEKQQALAEQLRASIGEQTLAAYLNARYRNYAVDALLLQMTQGGILDRVVLGQDDAGPVGLHVKEVRALQNTVQADGIGERSSIEPGADELGMAMVANALARAAAWTPHVAVRYSTPDGAATNDPLEFAPVSVAIDSLVALCGGIRDDTSPDVTLYVRVPGTGPAADARLIDAMRSDAASNRSIAFADLTFLAGTFASQAAFAEELLRDGLMSRLDAYSSWNTNANTVGTALGEAIAAGAGRRLGRYDRLAHMEFTFDRIVDDYAFHDYVRPELNAQLDAAGIADHTYLLPEQARAIESAGSQALWARAAVVLQRLYPEYHVAAIRITLPWDRTFETEIDARLAPNL